MELSKEEIDALKNIVHLSKGWPVGIYTEAVMATNLVEKELARWAVPSYPTERTDIYPIAITSWGEAHLDD